MPLRPGILFEIGVFFSSAEIANEMGSLFDQKIEKISFRLKLKQRTNGTEQIFWHGLENDKPVVFTVDPHTGFWYRFVIGFMGLLPIESQL